MMVWHGSHTRKEVLPAGTFVSKHLKEASKFGYRRAVQSNSPNVFLHLADVPPGDVARDITRDAAFVLLRDAPVQSIRAVPTYEVPYKLTRWDQR